MLRLGNDNGGHDAILGSALASDFGVDLSSHVMTLQGYTIQIDPTATFDGVFGGDGDDRLIGSTAAGSVLAGHAGDDVLVSLNAGADTLEGGMGNDVLVLGRGDRASGDSGSDVFCFITPQDIGTLTPADLAEILDFDASQDQLLVAGTDRHLHQAGFDLSGAWLDWRGVSDADWIDRYNQLARLAPESRVLPV